LSVGYRYFETRYLDVPKTATDQLEFYWVITNFDGSKIVDKQDNVRDVPYRANIIPVAEGVIELAGESLESSPTVKGKLRQGGSVSFVYDADRLFKRVGNSYGRGDEGFRVTLFWQFDGGEIHERDHISRMNSHFRADILGTELPTIEIPRDAKKMTVWLKGQAGTKVEYDSDGGNNHHFEIEPAGT
jgi:hypothetical protein